MTEATGSSELVERLRGRARFCRDRREIKSPDVMEEAADRITDLEARLARADASAPRPDNALADELASELYKEHASFLRDKDARDWDELPEAIKTGWMNEAHKRLEPVLRYISLAAFRSTPPEADSPVVDLLREAREAWKSILARMKLYGMESTAIETVDEYFDAAWNTRTPRRDNALADKLERLLKWDRWDDARLAHWLRGAGDRILSALRSTAPEADLRAENEALREVLGRIDALLTCGDGRDHYCPNCDNSTFEAREAVRQAIAQEQSK
jgi:hypothetical protein